MNWTVADHPSACRKAKLRLGITTTVMLGLSLALVSTPSAARGISPPGAMSTPQVSAAIAVGSSKPSPKIHEVTPTLNIDSGKKFGVAQTVTMRFPIAVSERKSVEQAITISGNRSLPPGRWLWLDAKTAVYRTKSFWPGNTRIEFRLDLHNVVLGAKDGSQYRGSAGSSHSYTLHTARKLVLNIRSRTQQMIVRRNGKRIRTIPVSLGKRGWETRSGIKVITSTKYRSIRLVGGGKTGAGWNVVSPYSIPITTDGEFLHAAPWARHRIGRAAGSHGCTNMNLADARWIFNRVEEGDPVVTRGTRLRMKKRLAIGQGKFWTYSWSRWRKLAHHSQR